MQERCTVVPLFGFTALIKHGYSEKLAAGALAGPALLLPDTAGTLSLCQSPGSAIHPRGRPDG